MPQKIHRLSAVPMPGTFVPNLVYPFHDFYCCRLLSLQPPLQVKGPAGCPDLAEYNGSILIPHSRIACLDRALKLQGLNFKRYKIKDLNI